MRGAQMDHSPDVLEQVSAVRLVEAAEVHGIDLLTSLIRYVAAGIEQVMLVTEFLAGEDHRDAHGGHLADEPQLDAAQAGSVQHDLTGAFAHFVGVGLPPVPSNPDADLGLDRAPVEQRLAARKRYRGLHEVVEPLFSSSFDVVAHKVVDHPGAIVEDPFDPAIDGPANHSFEVQAVRVLAQQNGSYQALKAFVPEPIQPLGAQQLPRHFQLFTDDQELGVRGRTRCRVSLLELLASGILEIADDVPIRDIFHAIHPDAIDLEVLHPATEEGQHVLSCRRDVLDSAGDRIVGGLSFHIARTRRAECVAKLPASALTRIERIGIVAMSFRVLEVEVIERDPPVRLLLHESEDDIEKESNAAIVAVIDDSGQIPAGCRSKIAFGRPQFVVSRQIVRGDVAPLARVNAIGRRQQLHGIYAELDELWRVQAHDG